jgi:hypothetical protein
MLQKTWRPWRRGRRAGDFRRGRRRPRARPGVEALEDRAVPATLFVVPPSGVLDTTHFNTFQDADQVAQANDVIQVEPGAAISSVGTVNAAFLVAGGQAGSTSITVVESTIKAGEMVEISGGTGDPNTTHPEDLLVVSTKVDSAGHNILNLDQPLIFDHSQSSGTVSAGKVTILNRLGINKALTIQGDTGVPAAITSAVEVRRGTSGVIFEGVNYTSPSPLRLDLGAKQISIRNSFLTSFQVQGGTGNQGVVLSGNVFTGPVFFGGNLAAPSASQVLNNRFIGSATLSVEDDSGAVIQGNTFTLTNLFEPSAITVVNSQNVQILNNTISVPVAGLSGPPAAIQLQGSAGTTSALVANNVLSTGGSGTGLDLSNPNGIVNVTAQGNDFHGNKVGVEINGVNPGTTGIDLGGGGQSLGGNNFRDFTAAGTSAGRFAIYRHNTDTMSITHALNNLFNVADPNTVIKDGTHNSTTGGGANGTGLIDVGTTQLSADQAYIQTLYNHFLGRTGSVTELNGWVSQLPSLGRTGVLNDIFRSAEGLGRVVDAFFLQYLQRSADSVGRASFVSFLQQGHTEEELAVQLVSSQEYFDRERGTFGGTDSSFVQSLFNKILGRNASAADVAGVVSMLPALGSRAGLARALLASNEYRAQVVRSYYTDLLHRPNLPAASEVNGWVNSGQDLLTIEFTFATTPEFYAQS